VQWRPPVFTTAGSITTINVTNGGSGYMTGIKKFVDGLPGLCQSRSPDSCDAFVLGADGLPLPIGLQPKYIPVAVPEAKKYDGVEAMST